mgnify:CR=1 FL=1
MYKILNILMCLSILIFTYIVFKNYSNINIDIKNYNRTNIDQILKEKVIGLPVLANDTDNVIEFNDSFENFMKDEKKRSFWNLLKSK